MIPFSRRKRQRIRARFLRPLLEPLEERSLLATIVVTSLNDNLTVDGKVTLREAIQAANTNQSIDGSAEGEVAPVVDTIVFQAGLTGSVNLILSELAITETVMIQGLGATSTTINAQHNSRLFNIASQAGAVTLDGMTLTAGNAGAANGGAILSAAAQLTVRNSTITGNQVNVNLRGGGISSTGAVTVTNSTVSGNMIANVSGRGGGIYAGSISLSNVTISGNSAGSGGGIYSIQNMTVADSTVTGNTGGQGGGVYSHFGVVTIRNSIVAGNTDTVTGFPDIGRSGSLDVNYSLIGDNNGTSLAAAPVGSPDANGNSVGTHNAPIDPRLAPLADNGGTTKTHALLADSPAIDAGDPSFAQPPDFDQRGSSFPRVADGPDVDSTARLDMGAFEFQSSPVPSALAVSTAVDENDSDFTAGDLSLREAVALANIRPDLNAITFAPELAGQPILLTLGQMNISDALTIEGLRATQTAVNGQNNSRLFEISSSAGAVTFDGLTLTGGKTSATNQDGGAIRSATAGQLTIQNSAISGNSTTGGFSGFFSGSFGAGISATGPVTISNSTISGNSTSGSNAAGAGIFTFGSVTLTNSTVSGNSTAGSLASGGGIYAWDAILITNSTITGNSVASGDGGGMYSLNGPVTIRNSIVAGNLDTQDGSAPDVRPAGTLTVNFSLIGDNNGTGLTAAPVATSPNFNLIGTHTTPLSPRLGPLQNNGGPTLTHRPLSGSPVIDAGSNSLAMDPVSLTPLATDQRGAPFARIVGATVDMGAVEDRSLLAQTLPFSQNWTDTGLITTDDDWTAVPGIVGYRGDGLTVAADTDPQTILVDGTSTPIDVIANQTDPSTQTTGGVAEFDGIANPVVALQGSGTAAAPFLLLRLNTTGQAGIRVRYDLRDIDSSTDNAVQQVALQYRIGSSGNFVNVPGGYVADASQGPNLAGLVTPVDVVLPSDANDQPLVQVRIMTSNANGADEWIGIDDIQIDATTPILPPTLPIMQNWTDTNLITRDDSWSGVPGIHGYRGDGLTVAADTDPQTILADGTSTPLDVIANQTDPSALTIGGVAEFDGITDAVVALQGSGTAAAPFLLLQVDTTGAAGIRVRYDLRDIDGSADNSVQQVALQYRIGSAGNFINLPAGYVPDASTGPNLAGLVTPVDVFLPSDADNQALVELRIITTNATGADEWIGIDNISVTSTLNHAPTCTVGAGQHTTDESGPQSVPNRVTNVSANDTGQSVTVSVSVDKPELFLVAPTVDAAGTLIYTPAPNVRGTAVVMVTLKDDGGTANGGVETSTQTQTIVIDKPHPWYNVVKPLDATNDNHVVAQDALVVINYLNAFGSVTVQSNAPIGQPFGFLDVDGDNQVAPIDALTIINAVNAGQGGEGEKFHRSVQPADEVFDLLALDVASQPRRRLS